MTFKLDIGVPISVGHLRDLSLLGYQDKDNCGRNCKSESV